MTPRGNMQSACRENSHQRAVQIWPHGRWGKEGRLGGSMLDCIAALRKVGPAWHEISSQSPLSEVLHVLEGWVNLSAPPVLGHWPGTAKPGSCANVIMISEHTSCTSLNYSAIRSERCLLTATVLSLYYSFYFPTAGCWEERGLCQTSEPFSLTINLNSVCHWIGEPFSLYASSYPWNQLCNVL
jgi:hypothetical protein